MSNPRKAFNVSEEVKEKINAVIEASGMGDKEWIEHVTNLYQMQELKKSSPDFNKDISELELHTKRINELVINMVERASFEKEEVIQSVDEIKESKNLIIEGLHGELQDLQERMKQYEQQAKDATEAKEEAEKRVKQLDEMNENNKLLIDEYKDKNDTLTGLVNQFRQSHEENASLKSQVEELKDSSQKLQTQLKEEQKSIKQIEEKHKNEIERITERKDIEKERELLKIRTDLQNQLQEAGQEQTSRIQSLYEKIEQLRAEHEKEIEGLKKQHEQEIKKLKK